jgi:hypothetical protein
VGPKRPTRLWSLTLFVANAIPAVQFRTSHFDNSAVLAHLIMSTVQKYRSELCL